MNQNLKEKIFKFVKIFKFRLTDNRSDAKYRLYRLPLKQLNGGPLFLLDE